MRRVLVVFAAGLALLFVAACGGDGDDGNGDPGDDVVESADGDGTDLGEDGDDGEDGGGGTAGVEQVCTEFEELFDTFTDDGEPLYDALIDAAEAGDDVALAEAGTDFLDHTNGFTQDVRDLAATSADPDVRSELEDFADELDAVAPVAVTAPERADDMDTSELDAAASTLGETCDLDL